MGMTSEAYEIYSEVNLVVYEFVSEGPNGNITKFVEYSDTLDHPAIWNLAFGDKDIHLNSRSDTAVTNNADTKKVLSTVASTIYLFTELYPDKMIFIKASTKSRIRLYRMIISNNFVEIAKEFNVYGSIGNVWNSFQPGLEYDSFLIERKTKILI